MVDLVSHSVRLFFGGSDIFCAHIVVEFYENHTFRIVLLRYNDVMREQRLRSGAFIKNRSRNVVA